ncbi:unnamed protein product [Adineta ricciae]|uniref:Uncharacterized protein n=1 Tax=Adineta ricciae TaxID=249248 RepID=A0A813VTJ9_ADIRI|nr:unnamed protein product [Adineta ricciae]CAF1188397.1 unnamed protein product [Adineta ricciae]
MASPVDSFKTSLFGQLKTFSTGVQGAFEQRIARPLIALKRDLERSSSKTRTSSDHDSGSSSQDTTFVTRQETLLSSSPLEIIDFETSNPVRSILDKIKSTVSIPVERKISGDCSTDVTLNNAQHSLLDKPSLSHHKSVSFAGCNQFVKEGEGSTDEPANQTNKNDCETDFDQQFRRMFKPRRISLSDSEELVYQDLSAEIVGYVLKHALRMIEKEEDEKFEQSQNDSVTEQDRDTIDLK